MTARKAVATATPPRARLSKWLKASKTSCAIPDRSNKEAINMKNGIATNEAVLVKSETLIITRPSPGRPKFNHMTMAPKTPDANPIGTPALNKIKIPKNIPRSIVPIPKSARKSVNKNSGASPVSTPPMITISMNASFQVIQYYCLARWNYWIDQCSGDRVENC